MFIEISATFVIRCEIKMKKKKNKINKIRLEIPTKEADGFRYLLMENISSFGFQRSSLYSSKAGQRN